MNPNPTLDAPASEPDGVRLVVSIDQQTLSLWHGQVCQAVFVVSTALAGAGEQSGSGCTPRGRHVVCQRIGAGMALGTVFVGRQPTGEVYSAALAAAHPDRDWILTRILWLAGCEPGFNQGHNAQGSCDSQARFIYIHGTPDSEPMGVARSHGCIRMRNDDVVRLFDQVMVGTPVWIGA